MNLIDMTQSLKSVWKYNFRRNETICWHLIVNFTTFTSRIYWEEAHDIVANVSGRDKFEFIASNIHLTNNDILVKSDSFENSTSFTDPKNKISQMFSRWSAPYW
jgi:hypothetical protein